MNPLIKAAEQAIRHSLKLQKGEHFLLVTDRQKMEIAENLAHWAKKTGAETTTYLMTESLRPITEATGLFRILAEKATAIAYMLDSRIEEKPFRAYMVKASRDFNRICMMPGITVDMMERLVNIDFQQLSEFTEKVKNALNGAEDIHIENPEGTNISFSVKGRQWLQDIGDISKKGKHGNLPAGECFTAPVEESFSGKLVISLIDDKLGTGVLEFNQGKLVDFSGKGVEEIIANIGDDPTGMIVGEFGVGTNPNAQICPNMLEAEKAFGTVHFAIGDSYGLGKNSSRHHYDALVDKVTIFANGKYIAKDGKFLL
jgi:aminopeptidase